MKRFLKISILATILLYYLASCGSAWHLQRAIKKNPSIISNKVDTITKYYPSISKTVKEKDSVIIQERGVYIHVSLQNDSISVFYEFLPDTVRIIETKTVFNVPKTRLQIRLENRNKRVEIRNKRKENIVKTRNIRKLEQTKIRKAEKTKRTEIRKKNSISSQFFLFVLGLLFGFLICLLTVKRCYYD